jgi:hypothetical protein
MLQKEAPLSDGCRRTLPDVIFEQLLRVWSVLGGGLPPPFVGSRDDPRLAILT